MIFKEYNKKLSKGSPRSKNGPHQERPLTLIFILQIYTRIYTENALNRTSYGSGKVMFNLQSVGHYGAWAIFMAIMGPYSLAHMGA